MPTKSLSCSTLQRVFKKKPLCLAISALLTQGIAHSAPVLNDPAGTKTGGVTVGSAAISRNGNVTTVNQTSSKAAINWWSFSTAPGETVNFVQPNSSSITLNRVIGNEKSVLQGALNANGKVFLINSNGVLITKGATINAAGFIASTLNLSDEDFRKGKYTFRSNGTSASVVNQGDITVANGGYVALLGNVVSNEGTITATKGTVSLNSGNKITLNFNGDSMLSVTIDEGTLNALVENKGAIYADGGQVIMTAKAADDLLSAQVNNTGIVQARTIDDLKGNIEIYAHGGTANIDGTLDASAPTSGDGGFIETSGDKVKIANSAKILTKSAKGKNGKWLIDPVDFTIAASGGDMTGAFLSNYLNTQGDYEVQSAHGSTPGSGDINVNDAVSWSSDTTLTLSAVRDININKSITATGSLAGLTLSADRDVNINAPVTLSGRYAAYAMNFGRDYNIRTKASYSGTVLDINGKPVARQDTSGGVYGSITLSGDDAVLTMNGTAYTLIHSMADLEAIAPPVRDGSGQPIFDSNAGDFFFNTATGNYALAQDIVASGTYATSIIGALNGTLAGLGHTISNLTIATNPDFNTDAFYAYGQKLGLISRTDSNNPVTIRDIGLTNVNISGDQYVGALLGYSDSPNLTIKNAYSTGSISAIDGWSGGLIGTTQGASTTIASSFSSVNGTYGDYGGGLIGAAAGANITNSHATGNVSGTGHIGGFAGALSNTYGGSNVTINNSYATGTVTSSDQPDSNYSYTGGFSSSVSNANVTNSFATGAVVGAHHVGGLIGNISYSTVDNTYATGAVSSYGGVNRGNENAATGGLIGYSENTDVLNSFATGAVTSTYNNSWARGIGGLIGVFNRGKIKNVRATGNVTATALSDSVGGLVGLLWVGDIYDSEARGNVIGGNHVGGIAGYAYLSTGTDAGASINNSIAYGNVSGNDYVGGIVGYGGSNQIIAIVDGQLVVSYVEGNVNGSIAYGNVSGNNYVGGIAGQGASITNSTAHGSVTGTGDHVDNVAGAARQITNSFHFLNGPPDLSNLSAEAVQQVGEIIQSAQRHSTATEQPPTFNNRSPSIENQITLVESRDYSAGIKSIMVDGVRFDLDDENKSDDGNKKQ